MHQTSSRQSVRRRARREADSDRAHPRTSIYRHTGTAMFADLPGFASKRLCSLSRRSSGNFELPRSPRRPAWSRMRAVVQVETDLETLATKESNSWLSHCRDWFQSSDTDLSVRTPSILRPIHRALL